MKNKQNEANKYECVLCETGEGSSHGGLCSCNKSKYEKGFNILIEYFDSISDEEKPEVSKRLKEIGL